MSTPIDGTAAALTRIGDLLENIAFQLETANQLTLIVAAKSQFLVTSVPLHSMAERLGMDPTALGLVEP